jgi:hypothetical protein
MKILKTYHLACYFLLSGTLLQAAPFTYEQFHSEYARILGSVEDTSYGTAGFGVSDPSSYYPLTTKPYPDPVVLSVNRNNGSVQGGIELSPTGLIVNDVGEYWVNISATVLNQGTDPLLVPIYLAVNDQYEATKIGNIGILVPNILTNVFGNGVITITDIGTTIDIIATNGESPFPHEIEVVSWGISLIKKQ